MNITLSTTSVATTQILVVEDEKIIALNLKENLESLGYTVVGIAASGQKAIEKATQLHPDLVLMDIRLQGDMDGIQTAEQIWLQLSIPVIYVTGNSDRSTLERAKATAPFGYILKPVKERELSIAIEIALQRYEREYLLTAILREMGDGAIVIDPERRIQFLNRAAEDLTGWRQDDAKQRDLTEVFQVVDAQTRQSVNDPTSAALQQGITTSLPDHTLLIAKDGTTIPIRDSVTPLKDNKGTLAGAVVVFQDITSSAKLEQANLALERAVDELQRTQVQLIQSEKMLSIGQMAAAVVNEMNSPVSFIYGNLPVARSYFRDLFELIALYQQTYTNPPANIQQLIETIDLEFIVRDSQKLIDSMQVGAERILEIVLSLLSLRNVSQLDEFDLKTVNIHDGIDHAIRILQHRLRAEGNRPEIRVIRDYGQIPQVMCYASQMNQVFLHLLSNAIDAIVSRLLADANDALDNQPEPRYITIRTETGNTQELAISSQAEPTTSNSQQTTDCVVIRIADNGCGMSEDVQQKMFDPFFTTKPLGSAKGLGLSISYQIVVERHHGQLTCHSVAGQGTEFAIVLPIVVSGEPLAANSEQ